MCCLKFTLSLCRLKGQNDMKKTKHMAAFQVGGRGDLD